MSPQPEIISIILDYCNSGVGTDTGCFSYAKQPCNQ